MILDSKPVYQVDGVSLDPYQSTLTYRGTGNERTTTYYDLYSTQSMVPMTLTVLAEGVAPVPGYLCRRRACGGGFLSAH